MGYPWIFEISASYMTVDRRGIKGKGENRAFGRIIGGIVLD
jgi:hypothetical protein